MRIDGLKLEEARSECIGPIGFRTDSAAVGSLCSSGISLCASVYPCLEALAHQRPGSKRSHRPAMSKRPNIEGLCDALNEMGSLAAARWPRVML